jgi:exodeoxyribonuclease VII large subunit
MTRESLTVSALNRAVAGLLTRGFPRVRVRGEVSGFMRAASGHWYFTLKDQAAQVRCVMFRARNALVVRAPRDGDAVEVWAQVCLYEPRGEYQLTIEAMQASGQGRLFEEFLRLRDRLAAQGVFDEALKRPLPAVPRAIGVITSLQAAALRDVVTTLERRAPHCAVIVYPVPVQGAGAGAQIAAMLDKVSRRAEVDVALLVRGGGSIEDLWAFNEEIVARALRRSAVPVVVGVGHETDFTIADFAADVRAPTPTAAAELVAVDRQALSARVGECAAVLRRRMAAVLHAAQQRADYAQRALSGPQPLSGLHARIREQGVRLSAATSAVVAGARSALAAHLQARAHARPRVDALVARLHRQRDVLQAAVKYRLETQRAGVARWSAELGHLDPQAVLERGYSIVRDAQGEVVRDAAALEVRAQLDVTFARGGATVRVEELRRTSGD